MFVSFQNWDLIHLTQNYLKMLLHILHGGNYKTLHKNYLDFLFAKYFVWHLSH